MWCGQPRRIGVLRGFFLAGAGALMLEASRLTEVERRQLVAMPVRTSLGCQS